MVCDDVTKMEKRGARWDEEEGNGLLPALECAGIMVLLTHIQYDHAGFLRNHEISIWLPAAHLRWRGQACTRERIEQSDPGLTNGGLDCRRNTM